MSVRTVTNTAQTASKSRLLTFLATLWAFAHDVLAGDLDIRQAATALSAGHRVDEATTRRFRQMGAKRIGQLAIGIGVVGIVLNEMSSLDIVGNSTGVIDVSGIFETAGSGLNLLVVGVIIAAAAVLLSLWGGF